MSGGPWTAAWRRLRRDGWSMAALVTVGVIVVVGLTGGALLSRAVGHNGTDPFPYAVDNDRKPVSPWTQVYALSSAPIDDYGQIQPPPKGTKKQLFVLGADGPLGRDEAIRLADGIRTSLEIGLGAALIALLVALPLGAVAGYFGGAVDTVVSWLTETLMAFPLLLFLVFASARLGPQLRSFGWSWVVPAGVVGEAILIGLFTAFYPLRLIRAHMLTLRRAEFVEAANMIGASHWRILRRHLLPHVAPTILVWSAIAVATNILLEVGLSFIGIGVQPSTPSLGSLLSTTWGTIYSPLQFDSRSFTPWQTICPMAVILLTVVCLNQLSDGARRALDPWTRR